MKLKIIFILTLLTFFLISCSQEQNLEPSCEVYMDAANNAYEVLGDYNFLDPEKVEIDCNNIYLEKARNQELCTKDDAVYPSYCNQMVGYFAKDGKACMSEDNDNVISCILGFALNKNSNCKDFTSLEIEGHSLKDVCLFYKSSLGDESVCKEIEDDSRKEICVSSAKVASYDEEKQCGDGKCEYPESNWACPEDCMTIPKELLVDDPPTCGDGICEELEDCMEKLCTEGKDECISSCPYSCQGECRYRDIMYGCEEGVEPSNNIYKKESFKVFHYQNEKEEICVIVKEETYSDGGISKSMSHHGEDCTGPQCNVLETFCSDGNYREEYVKCPNGCKDGACIK